MTADMLDLARRAVACPKWRWMPGMRTTEGIRIVHDPSRFPGACALRDGGWTPRLLDPGALPDLTDPATLGCLLALVQKARREPTYLPTLVGIVDKWVISPPITWRQTRYDSYAAVLVAALEAAP